MATSHINRQGRAERMFFDFYSISQIRISEYQMLFTSLNVDYATNPFIGKHGRHFAVRSGLQIYPSTLTC